MKKFSKIAKVKVAKEPEVKVVERSEEDIMKTEVMKLMDNYLGVQIYGPVTRYQVAGLIKVKGKEVFLEALFDMLRGQTDKKAIKILESMKSETKDWKSIDDKITQLNESLRVLNYPQSHKLKIIDLYNKYGQDDELMEKSLFHIKDIETAKIRSEVANEMIQDNRFSSEIMSKISQLYSERAYLLQVIKDNPDETYPGV